MPFDRIKSIYILTGITLLTTSLLVAVAVMVSYVIVGFRDRARGVASASAPYSSYLSAKAIHSMPAAEAAEFFREFDRMGERETYVYRPWVGFSKRVYPW